MSNIGNIPGEPKITLNVAAESPNDFASNFGDDVIVVTTTRSYCPPVARTY